MFDFWKTFKTDAVIVAALAGEVAPKADAAIVAWVKVHRGPIVIIGGGLAIAALVIVL